MRLRLYCHLNYYNAQCSQYCVADDGPKQHYTCDPVTGNKSCRPGKIHIRSRRHHVSFHQLHVKSRPPYAWHRRWRYRCFLPPVACQIAPSICLAQAMAIPLFPSTSCMSNRALHMPGTGDGDTVVSFHQLHVKSRPPYAWHSRWRYRCFLPPVACQIAPSICLAQAMAIPLFPSTSCMSNRALHMPGTADGDTVVSFHQLHVKSRPPYAWHSRWRYRCFLPPVACQIAPSICLAQPMAIPLADVRSWVEQTVPVMGQTSKCCLVGLMPQSQYPYLRMFTLDRPICVHNRSSVLVCG